MSSKEMKASVLFYLLYRLHFMAAVTEYGGTGCEGIADLFGITDADFSHEIEVKVSKSDLVGELNAIKFHMRERLEPVPIHPKGMMEIFGTKPAEPKLPPPKNMSKSTKHWWYLAAAMKHEWRSKPNRFSFAVPQELSEFAKEELKGSPYGLLVVTIHENGGHPWTEVACVKRAEWLHREKVDQKIFRKVLHKSCTEIQSLRASALAK